MRQEIIILQNGKKCELWAKGYLVKTAGRCEIKRDAMALHKETEIPVYNIKKGGEAVLVTDVFLEYVKNNLPKVKKGQ